MPVDLLAEVQSIVEVKGCTRGYTVYRQGQPADGLYIVRTGWVKLFHVDESGRRSVIGVAKPGDVLGLLAVVTSTSYHSGAETLEDCELEYVPSSEFAKVLEKNPRLALDLLKAVGHQTRQSREEFYRFAAPSAERLLSVLNELAESCGQATADGIKLRIQITVQDLADKIGCSRQWTTKLLAELEEKKIIRRVHGWIVLANARQSLKKVAGQ